MKARIERSDEYVRNQRIATGQNVPAIIEIEIEPADLSLAAREILIENHHGAYPATLDGLTLRRSTYNTSLFRLQADLDSATPGIVSDLILAAKKRLDAAKLAWEEQRRTDEEVKQEQTRARIAQTTPAVEAFLADPGQLPIREPRMSDVVHLSGASIGPWHPQFERVRAEAIARWETEEKRKEQEERASQERRAAQLAAWVEEFGTPGMKKRAARGLLSYEEIISAIREQAFAPLADLPRYERITKDDVVDSYEDHFGDHDYAFQDAIFSGADAETATDEQMDLIERIEGLIPGATATLRVHQGLLSTTTREQDEIAGVKRHSILVTVQVGELTLSREFAA